MPRDRFGADVCSTKEPSLSDLLTARPVGLTESESWAILCQAVQALQDLFLSDGASGGKYIPLVTPSSLLLSTRGRVKLCQSLSALGCGPPAHLSGYLAPEYRPNKQYTDTEAEKMWIYGLGETLKRATLTSHAATSRLSGELCQVLADMTKTQAASRATLMHLLDVISEYCKRRQQNKPFSHIVMDVHQEAMVAIELTMDTPWGPPAMPELRPRTRNRCDSVSDGLGTLSMPRRWPRLVDRAPDLTRPKLTREASTSMEDLSLILPSAPGALIRPKSMCVPDMRTYEEPFRELRREFCQPMAEEKAPQALGAFKSVSRRKGTRRNPVQRAASRLYRAGSENQPRGNVIERDCVGPEFVVRAGLPNKQISIRDIKPSARKTVTVIMLNGQKVDVICNPSSTTAGQLFELIIQKEHIEENFMLGLSALIAGDFVFLPSDTRICKAIMPGTSATNILTLFMRVRFFLPSLRGIRGTQARHLLYLQLRRSILEHQLPCSFTQIVELNGIALQAEFGDYNEREHGTRDYFLLEHYVPESMTYAVEDLKALRQELVRAHMSKCGLDSEKAEHDFIVLAQGLPHYGGHFYTATWVLKDNTSRDVWLYVSAQGINLYERGTATLQGPKLYEMFEWRTIQTLCYSKHYLCILPHSTKMHSSKLKKYKLKMNHKKSYFTFRLASLHHQFFLRLRTEYTSLQTLSQQFGIPLKDMKNETNSLYKLEALTNPAFTEPDNGTVNAETEFQIEFRASTRSSHRKVEETKAKRSKSVNDFTTFMDDEFVNKENENPKSNGDLKKRSGLILDSSCLSGLPVNNDKRRGVKMGVRAFSNTGVRISRSMEAVNGEGCEDLEQLSLQSVSLHCSSPSLPRSPVVEHPTGFGEAYILDSTIKSCSNQFLPDFQETLSESLIDKFNNMSFAEERLLRTVTIERDASGSLGMQITEGSDGKVYVQSVIVGGPAHMSANIFSGDQIVAVNGRNLLGMKYSDALTCLKSTGHKVQFIVSHLHTSKSNESTLRIGDLSNLKNRRDLTNISESHLEGATLENTVSKLKRTSYKNSPIEKYLTESCHDSSNVLKYNVSNERSTLGTPSEVPYHKHIRYEIEPEKDNLMSKKNIPSPFDSSSTLNKRISKSCTQIYDNNKAVVVGIYPKSNSHSLKSRDEEKKFTIPPIALPRSLGLSRKWRGPVKYPVTPIKRELDLGDSYLTNSDDEQVFI